MDENDITFDKNDNSVDEKRPKEGGSVYRKAFLSENDITFTIIRCLVDTKGWIERRRRNDYRNTERRMKCFVILIGS